MVENSLARLDMAQFQGDTQEVLDDLHRVFSKLTGRDREAVARLLWASVEDLAHAFAVTLNGEHAQVTGSPDIFADLGGWPSGPIFSKYTWKRVAFLLHFWQYHIGDDGDPGVAAWAWVIEEGPGWSTRKLVSPNSPDANLFFCRSAEKFHAPEEDHAKRPDAEAIIRVLDFVEKANAARLKWSLEEEDGPNGRGVDWPEDDIRRTGLTEQDLALREFLTTQGWAPENP